MDSTKPRSLKKPLCWLVLALVVVLGFSWLASGFHGDFGKVQISRVSFDTDRGTLSGLLYLPKGADTQPRPAVVLTHGYLNSGEMQDLNAIELSRRGHVVLALDMYDHGHSALNADRTGNFFAFWPSAMYDAVQFIYDQPYTLKDEAGNGIIGVTGHSMGGFSSTAAIYLDEQDFLASGIRKIYAGLPHGADYLYTSMLGNFGFPEGITPEVLAKNGGGRTLGMLAAQFDEFFFNADGNTGGSVKKKDYVATASAKAYLEQQAPEPGVWYDTADGGQRIVYQPYQIHPWNHFSKIATEHTLDFYQKAFADHAQHLSPLPSNQQVWFFKELSELIALIGFVLFFVPFISLLRRLPFLRLAKTATPALLPQPKPGVLRYVLLALGILLPAIIFPSVMDKKLDGTVFLVARWLALALGLFGLVQGILCYLKKKQLRALVPGAMLVLAGIALFVLLTYPSFPTDRSFPAPTTNQIVYWALISGLLSLVLLAIGLIIRLRKADDQPALNEYGLKAGLPAILASLLTALVAFAAGYGLVFLVDALFLTDFRFWTFAFKTFQPAILPISLRYLPFFFVFYFISAISITYNTATQKLAGLRGTCRAILLNAGGVVLYLVAHYGLLFATGTALFPTQSLSSILLFGFVPVLTIAAIFTRALYKRDGNIWTAAFLNALLMTLVTVANTAVYYQR